MERQTPLFLLCPVNPYRFQSNDKSVRNRHPRHRSIAPVKAKQIPVPILFLEYLQLLDNFSWRRSLLPQPVKSLIYATVLSFKLVQFPDRQAGKSFIDRSGNDDTGFVAACQVREYPGPLHWDAEGGIAGNCCPREAAVPRVQAKLP